MAGKYVAPPRVPNASRRSKDGVTTATVTTKPVDRKTKPMLIVHAGASKIPDELCMAYLRGVREAANSGFIAMMESKSARDGVEAAVMAMENNPLFFAGTGGALNLEGKVECDAAIMEGRTMKAGAVGGVKTVRNPIRAARMVMDKSDHVLLVGEGAEKFAARNGLPAVDNSNLITEYALKNFKKNQVFNRSIHNSYSAWYQRFCPIQNPCCCLSSLFRRSIRMKLYIKTHFPHLSDRASSKEVTSKTDLKRICSTPAMDGSCDSVGAVALDAQGRTAVALSTGGITGKLPGRLGDSALPGCGFYADDNVGTVCCTGHGEMIMRAALAQRIISAISRGERPQKACQEGLDFMRLRLDGYGGVIAISASGGIGLSFSAFRMPWAYRTTDELHYGIEKGDHFVQKPGDSLDAPLVRFNTRTTVGKLSILNNLSTFNSPIEETGVSNHENVVGSRSSSRAFMRQPWCGSVGGWKVTHGMKQEMGQEL
ncbi:unnamed protein product [Notodromas monacha]|uniref:Isoaspartyl peptidase/L-asparaginase n=1 Tax=Notodromas monacha TaxID=399045 RepID=A0A7R9BKQ0_9CRUS|nr:unnamed protein product [Notodromas monacha]CAG0915927.1 unnamed protein product [Notodromas monacha]